MVTAQVTVLPKGGCLYAYNVERPTLREKVIMKRTERYLATVIKFREIYLKQVRGGAHGC